MKKGLLFMFFVFAIGLGSWYIIVQSRFVAPIVVSVSPTPSPFPEPFIEMTVPYLQQYRYTTRLETQTLIATNDTYRSYLTSYLSDGYTINGLLTIPMGQSPTGGWPAVIFIHGYIPPTQYRTLERYTDYVDYLAKSGFIVFKIDLRGNGDSQGIPGGTYYSGDYIKDVINAYTALMTSGVTKAGNVGLWGHSMAGNIIARTMAARPEFQVAVIWAGAVYTYQDMLDFGINDSSYQRQDENYNQPQVRQRLFDVFGRYSADNTFWKQVVPIEYLKKNHQFIQIHHALDDSVVSIEYSRNFVRQLQDGTTKVELFEYASGGHNISGNSFNTAMQRTVEFFKNNLGVNKR